MKTIVIGSVLLGVVASASAQVLYSNGSINGTVDARNISEGWMVSDSFTLASDSVIASATAGIWTDPGANLTSVHWSITTAPLGGTLLASGTASSIANNFVGNADGLDVNSDTFAINASLSAGSYWFQLDSAVANGNGIDNVYWDINNGPSSAVQSTVGSVASESFTLNGTAAPVPEPASIGLLGVGIAGLFMARRRQA